MNLRTGCGKQIVVYLICAIIGALCFNYVVEYWVGLIQKAPVEVPVWVSVIGGLVVWEVIIPATIITWLLSFVINNPYA